MHANLQPQTHNHSPARQQRPAVSLATLLMQIRSVSAHSFGCVFSGHESENKQRQHAAAACAGKSSCSYAAYRRGASAPDEATIDKALALASAEHFVMCELEPLHDMCGRRMELEGISRKWLPPQHSQGLAERERVSVPHEIAFGHDFPYCRCNALLQRLPSGDESNRVRLAGEAMRE
jgi:hypothetical protein